MVTQGLPVYVNPLEWTYDLPGWRAEVEDGGHRDHTSWEVIL